MLSKQSKIVIASNNSGKLREFQALLTNCGFIASPQCDYQVPEPEETGLSFVEKCSAQSSQRRPTYRPT